MRSLTQFENLTRWLQVVALEHGFAGLPPLVELMLRDGIKVHPANSKAGERYRRAKEEKQAKEELSSDFSRIAYRQIWSKQRSHLPHWKEHRTKIHPHDETTIVAITVQSIVDSDTPTRLTRFTIEKH